MAASGLGAERAVRVCARVAAAGFAAAVCVIISALLGHALTFPPLTARVVDEAGILDPATKNALERKLADFERATTGQFAR